MITYQVEPFSKMYHEGMALFDEHWDEIARHKEHIKLNPDYDKYISLERMGVVHVVTARNDGCLIGYAINFVAPNMHYQDWLYSVNDIIYISIDYRKTGAGYRLLRFMEKELKKIGVTNIHLSMKLAHDFGPLMESLGYTAIERLYEKFIGDQ